MAISVTNNVDFNNSFNNIKDKVSGAKLGNKKNPILNSLSANDIIENASRFQKVKLHQAQIKLDNMKAQEKGIKALEHKYHTVLSSLSALRNSIDFHGAKNNVFDSKKSSVYTQETGSPDNYLKVTCERNARINNYPVSVKSIARKSVHAVGLEDSESGTAMNKKQKVDITSGSHDGIKDHTVTFSVTSDENDTPEAFVAKINAAAQDQANQANQANPDMQHKPRIKAYLTKNENGKLDIIIESVNTGTVMGCTQLRTYDHQDQPIIIPPVQEASDAKLKIFGQESTFATNKFQNPFDNAVTFELISPNSDNKIHNVQTAEDTDKIGIAIAEFTDAYNEFMKLCQEYGQDSEVDEKGNIIRANLSKNETYRSMLNSVKSISTLYVNDDNKPVSWGHFGIQRSTAHGVPLSSSSSATEIAEYAKYPYLGLDRDILINTIQNNGMDKLRSLLGLTVTNDKSDPYTFMLYKFDDINLNKFRVSWNADSTNLTNAVDDKSFKEEYSIQKDDPNNYYKVACKTQDNREFTALYKKLTDKGGHLLFPTNDAFLPGAIFNYSGNNAQAINQILGQAHIPDNIEDYDMDINIEYGIAAHSHQNLVIGQKKYSVSSSNMDTQIESKEKIIQKLEQRKQEAENRARKKVADLQAKLSKMESSQQHIKSFFAENS